MAIQMTRQEYEKVYGVKPVAPSVSALDDEKPAPIRMTRAEYEQTYRPKTQTFSQDAKQDITETGIAQQEALQEGAATSGEITQRVESGETSKIKGLFQKFGTGLGTATNVLFQTALGGAKAILPQKAEEYIANGFKALGNEISSYNKEFYEKEVLPDLQSDDPDKQAAAKTIVATIDAYNNDANFRTDVQAAGGILEWLSLPGAKKLGTEVIEGAVDVGKTTLKQADEIVVPIAKKFDERGVTNVVNEIAKIEDKYAGSRKANQYSKDVEASRRRIAESDVLDGAVDTDGVIRTKTPGGVIDRYKEQTIDKYESLVRDSLIASKETIPMSEVRRVLIREVGNSGLEGADLVSALKKIDKEIEGLNARIKGSSIVDLRYLHDNKIATTKNINYQTPPEKATYRKAIARAYKVLVEDNSKKVEVKKINERLGMYYDDIARLERLDGARAEGGRLGKYTASIAGTGIGMAAGSLGGGVGAAIGGVIGGEAAQALKGVNMSRTFKGGGKGLAKDAVLEQARLSIPDKAIKATSNIKKTPEIEGIEKQIAKNVAEQTKAIEMGDFALVQALKEIYAVLVDELNRAIKYLDENASVGMSIRSTVTPENVAKNADRADMDMLAKVIDNYEDAILDPDINRVLDEMGLGKATREERIRFAKDVFDEQGGTAGMEVIAKDS